MPDASQARVRPRYHLTAPANWLNDPNGPVYWQGRWHLYYQHNPAAPAWGRMHWGHASSEDLVTWQDHGIALEPGDGADADGCWSGTAVIVDDDLQFFYTGARGEGAAHEQTVMRAVPADDGLNLRRDPDWPVLVIDRRAVHTGHQRDPFLVRWGSGWLMLLGTALPDAGGAVAAWWSRDLRHWRYQGVPFSRPPGDAIETGPVWECPQLVEIDGRWILLVSVQLPEGDAVSCLHVVWFLGSFDGSTFTPESSGVLDAGDCFYATALATGTDRRLLWGWLQESPALRQVGPRDFSGALSVPRELYVEGGRVGLRPAAELEALWGSPVPIGSPVAPCYRLSLPVDAEAVAVLGRDGGDADVVLRVADGELTVGAFRVDLPSCPVDVEVLVDSSIVEIFAAGRAISFRVDPQLDTTRGVEIHGTARESAELRPWRRP
jgi:beta-fructofuranosidase